MSGTARGLAKAVARAMAAAMVSPALLAYAVQARLVGRDRALQNATQGLALLPGLSGQYLRRAFLSRTLEACHPTATVEFGTTFSRAGARLGENVYIGPMCHIGLAHVDRDALIGPGVHIPSGPRTHGTADPSRAIGDQPGERSQVRIGAGAWIGSASVVMADVGRGTVVGAGAIVTRPLPDRVVAAGAPARVLRSLDLG